MADLSPIDLLGFWIGIFLTFCILSFLYKDNPFYKFAEHLFIGVSIGYVVTKQYYDTLSPKLIENLGDGKWWYVIGLALAIMLLLKLFRKTAHVGRYPIAFVVGLFAGLQITGVAQGDLGKQVDAAMDTVIAQEVDINTATKTELQLLPGLSPVVANKIIARRAERPFTSLDELVTLPGLTEMQIADIRAARGSIAGIDAEATTMEVHPAASRVDDLRSRLKAFLSSRDKKLDELKGALASAEKEQGEAKGEAVAKATKKTGEAREALAAMEKRFADADAMLVLINGPATPSSHRDIAALEQQADAFTGAALPGRRGDVFIFGTLSKILLLLGLLAGLIYFYFSIEQKGAVGKVSRFGVWVLMIGFGASFGYTVQGRISLAIGRVLDITGANKDPNVAEQISGVWAAVISIGIIIAGLAIWEFRQRGGDDSGPSGDGSDEPPAPEPSRDEEE